MESAVEKPGFRYVCLAAKNIEELEALLELQIVHPAKQQHLGFIGFNGGTCCTSLHVDLHIVQERPWLRQSKPQVD